jgi:hypothetical protein
VGGEARPSTAIASLRQRCYICNARKHGWHLHHRTYDRLGCEDLRDLVPLCQKLPHGDPRMAQGQRWVSLFKAHRSLRSAIFKRALGKDNPNVGMTTT